MDICGTEPIRGRWKMVVLGRGFHGRGIRSISVDIKQGEQVLGYGIGISGGFLPPETHGMHHIRWYVEHILGGLSMLRFL